jgi:hypothetical protein
MKIEMNAVKSSNIDRIGYDEPSKTLAIEFRTGATYHYYEVPKDVYESLKNAESVGAYFAQNIKGSYAFHKEE